MIRIGPLLRESFLAPLLRGLGFIFSTDRPGCAIVTDGVLHEATIASAVIHKAAVSDTGIYEATIGSSVIHQAAVSDSVIHAATVTSSGC